VIYQLEEEVGVEKLVKELHGDVGASGGSGGGWNGFEQERWTGTLTRELQQAVESLT
jgi:hypothetical protein